MKTFKYTSKLHLLTLIALVVLFMMTLTSCEKEPIRYSDGQPGRAFVAFHFIDIEPDYIEQNNPDVPNYFDWDDYYQTFSGFYNLYYEIEYYNFFFNRFYVDCWEVDYEIWQIPGEAGTYHHWGRDGRDVYFDIELTPDGPYVYSDSKGDTIPSKMKDYTILSRSNDQVILQQTKEGFGIKVKYNKVKKHTRP